MIRLMRKMSWIGEIGCIVWHDLVMQLYGVVGAGLTFGYVKTLWQRTLEGSGSLKGSVSEFKWKALSGFKYSSESDMLATPRRIMVSNNFLWSLSCLIITHPFQPTSFCNLLTFACLCFAVLLYFSLGSLLWKQNKPQIQTCHSG